MMTKTIALRTEIMMIIVGRVLNRKSVSKKVKMILLMIGLGVL